MRAFFFPCVAALVAVVHAQQLITTVDELGNTVVEQVTLDPAGLPTTQTLQTLPPGVPAIPTTPPLTSVAVTTTNPLAEATTQATSTPPMTIAAPPVQQGPVGQPASPPAEAGDPTPYSYTTTDANGDKMVVPDVFTPSFPATTPFTPSSTGSIWGYSAWLKMIGNATAGLSQPVASQIANEGVVYRSFSIGTSVLSSLIVGAVLLAVS